MGSVYYLAFAVTEEAFSGALEVWAVSILVIVVSIVIHGITSSAAMARVDAARP